MNATAPELYLFHGDLCVQGDARDLSTEDLLMVAQLQTDLFAVYGAAAGETRYRMFTRQGVVAQEIVHRGLDQTLLNLLVEGRAIEERGACRAGL